ncbi:MAG: dehydrogenase, short-chain alcohol dehydrogenase like [Acidimicrobiales bacterium]|nr:dehydrogenase, short-chain alcohol dehydrogenase like [Acidimicrobiales bacterium]
MGRQTDSDLTGKVAVVTGANSGIGKETALALARMGATVVMCARDPERGAVAVADIRAQTGSDRVELGDLDLASFASIRGFAAWLLDRHPRLDILVNNAGLVTDKRLLTSDGFEVMFGVNHLGHFLLTDLLRERLVASAPARIVVVSSVAHRFAIGGLPRADLQSEHAFVGFRTYAYSKLANIAFTRELARRLDGTGVTVNCLHPGNVRTHFAGDGDTRMLGALLWATGWLVLRSPKGGAKTSILLASSPDPRVAGVTGGYFSHGRQWRPSRRARDADAARWLWDESERLLASVEA